MAGERRRREEGNVSVASFEAAYEEFHRYMNKSPCEECGGTRLRQEARHIRVGGQSITELTALPRLQALLLNGAPITDKGLRELSRLKSLQTLRLGGTQVTDEGLWHLTLLGRLQSLDLGNTKVTRSGREELGKQLLGCQIE